MKTLTLLRHAKSGWNDPGQRDFDRPLNGKGERAAHIVGRQLRTLGLEFDAVIASPAVRVKETLDHVADGYGAALAARWDRRIYLASAVTLLDVIHETPDDAGRLLLVGHNPGLEDLVLMLVPDSAEQPLRDDVEEKFPTASIAELSFTVDRWADVAADTAGLARFMRPRDLDPALGPDQD